MGSVEDLSLEWCYTDSRHPRVCMGWEVCAGKEEVRSGERAVSAGPREGGGVAGSERAGRLAK